MSLSATGSGNTAGELAAAIVQMLSSAKFTSAGGDSPKQNSLIQGSIPTNDFGSLLDDAVRTAVLRHMEDNGMIEGLSGDGITPNESGLGEGQAVGVARSGISKVQNPTQLVGDALGLLPHAVLVSFAISLIPLIIEELTKPGGEFDLRFKRIIEKEYNALQDRQTQFDLAIGERGAIIQARAGFLNRHGGATNANTLRQIREGGINRDTLNQIDYTDHAKGLR